MQNNNLVDHLLGVDDLQKKTSLLAEVSQREKYQMPSSQKRQINLYVLIGILVVIVLLLGIIGGLYLEQLDSRNQHIGSLQVPSVRTVPFAGSIRESALLIPDLTVLLGLLNSNDPNIQERGVAPMMRKGPNGTPGLLPARSKIEVRPETWKVLNVDEKNEPYVAWIQALVTVPGENVPRHYDLHLIHVDEQWLLYSTIQR